MVSAIVIAHSRRPGPLRCDGNSRGSRNCHHAFATTWHFTMLRKLSYSVPFKWLWACKSKSKRCDHTCVRVPLKETPPQENALVVEAYAESQPPARNDELTARPHHRTRAIRAASVENLPLRHVQNQLHFSAPCLPPLGRFGKRNAVCLPVSCTLTSGIAKDVA